MKRKRPTHADLKARKRRQGAELPSPARIIPSDAVLRVYYPTVQTLRAYLLSQILDSSRKRRKIILQYDLGVGSKETDNVNRPNLELLLDSTLVGSPRAIPPSAAPPLDQEIQVFAEKLSQCTPGATLSQGLLSQAEVGFFFRYLQDLVSQHTKTQTSAGSVDLFRVLRLSILLYGVCSDDTAPYSAHHTCFAMGCSMALQAVSMVMSSALLPAFLAWCLTAATSMLLNSDLHRGRFCLQSLVKTGTRL